MNRCLLLMVAAALAVSACKKQETEQAPEPQPAKAAEISDTALEQADLPVKEDFEEEAVQKIDEDNLEGQLDALEQEIAADKE